MPYLFLTLAAIFRALTQLIVFKQAGQSWLPRIVFEWDLSHWLSVLDAYHVYQGCWEVCLLVGFYLLGGIWWGWIGVIVLGYWQVFNAFYHIVFRYPRFWRWPWG